MNIDFIKWMVGYAEGFEYYEGGQINDPANFIYTLDKLNDNYLKDIWELINYPLLLQRAIEGINNKYYHEGSKISPLYIKIVPCGVLIAHAVDDWSRFYDLSDYDTIDQAKEQALKYIYEQEKNDSC